MEMTVDKIKSYKPVTKEVTSVDSAGEENTFSVTGTLFDDILADYGKTQDEIGDVRFIAGDGYSIEVPADIVQARDIIFAYEIDGKPLDDNIKPLRAIVPDERAMYWVSNLVKIEILDMKTEAQISKVVILESAFDTLKQEDYTYYESVDKAIKTADLLNTYTEGVSEDTVYIKASDRLEKDETYDIFSNAYLKITGEDIPLFLAPDMPKGMHVKDILMTKYGNTAFISADKAIEIFDKKSIEDNEGISIMDIVNETGIQKADDYILTALDGYSTEISLEDISKGIVYKRKKGGYTLKFEGLSKDTAIKNILSIEAK